MTDLNTFLSETKKAAMESATNYGWRYGQAVFNYVDHKYGVARAIQFVHHVDCFYDDSKVDEFLTIAYRYLNS